MRTTLADGTPVRIVFRHEEFKAPKAHVRQGQGRHSGEVVDIAAETTCAVVRVNPKEAPVGHEVIVEGHARRSVLDQPIRAEDRRKIALFRAVAGLSREDRGRVLQAYFSRRQKAGSVGAVRA